MSDLHESRVRLVAGIGFGLAAGSLVALARDANLKMGVPALLGLIFLLLIAVCEQRERLCMFLFLITAPLPMHGFIRKLEPLHGGGALGIYLMAADLPLIFLYAFWLYDWALNRDSPAVRSNRFVTMLLPFLGVGALSITYSVNPLWALCEWLRWIKVSLILLYVTKRLRFADLKFCAHSLAFSSVVQSALAIAQSVRKSNLGLDRLGFLGAAGQEALTQTLAGNELLFRGSALTGHPNFLASYLLLLVPIFGLSGLVESNRRHQAMWLIVMLISLGGLASTMSRAAWASCAVGCAIALIGAVWFSIMSLRHLTIILALMVTAAGVVVISPFGDLAFKRFQADFSESWRIRVEMNRSALSMAQDHPLFGVGLNNYTIVYPNYNPQFANLMLEMNDMLTVVHNSYLLILAEVGGVGLAAYLAFYFASVIMGFMLLHQMSRWSRALSLGIICGIISALLFDLTEVSLWMEITMYTIAVLVGMLEVAADSPGRLGMLASNGQLHYRLNMVDNLHSVS
jgi:putative inorganic carbon (hco3(-)) transporter